MATTGVHNRILAAAARRALSPLGVTQRGRSRVWLDDHGWWLVAIEFQSSSWARGSYLNAGAMWLWQPTDHISFDFGNRVEGFHEFTDQASFEAAAADLAGRAAREVLRYRALFPDVWAVARELAPQLATGGWARYHAAVAAGLAGDVGRAEAALRAVAVPDPTDFPWLRELRAWAGRLSELVTRPQEFAARLTQVVHTTRAALKLPAWSGALPYVGGPVAAA